MLRTVTWCQQANMCKWCIQGTFHCFDEAVLPIRIHRKGLVRIAPAVHLTWYKFRFSMSTTLQKILLRFYCMYASNNVEFYLLILTPSISFEQTHYQQLLIGECVQEVSGSKLLTAVEKTMLRSTKPNFSRISSVRVWSFPLWPRFWL